MPKSQPPLEASIKKRFRALCERYGLKVIKFHGSAFSEAGLPDLLVLPWERRETDGFRKGVWVELKRPGRDASVDQKAQMADLVARGETAILADDPVEGYRAASRALMTPTLHGRLLDVRLRKRTPEAG